MAATPRTSFLSVSFDARAADPSAIVFLRPGQCGTTKAVQYGPALNCMGAAWQVYHGRGANAATDLPREHWISIKLVLSGASASVYTDGTVEPTLVVPRLAGAGGHGLGVWTGLFGRGAYFADFAYTPAPVTPIPALPAPAPGTITDWRISQRLDAGMLMPGTLPDLDALTWDGVQAEPAQRDRVRRHGVQRRVGILGTPGPIKSVISELRID